MLELYRLTHTAPMHHKPMFHHDVMIGPHVIFRPLPTRAVHVPVYSNSGIAYCVIVKASLLASIADEVRRLPPAQNDQRRANT
jgi:hypothetical protein